MSTPLTDDDREFIVSSLVDAEAGAVRARLNYFGAFIKSADGQVLKLVGDPRGPRLEPHPPVDLITRARRTDVAVLDMLLTVADCGALAAAAAVPDGNAGGWDRFRAWATSDANDAFRALSSPTAATDEVKAYLKARDGLLSAVHTYNVVRVIVLRERIRGNRATSVPALKFCLNVLMQLRGAVLATHASVHGESRGVNHCYV